MALTDKQLMDVRRYAGYQLAGTDAPLTDDQDQVYIMVGLVTMSLHKRLGTLTAVQESTLISVYLTSLAVLETALVGASANLDTDAASVWTHNKNEVDDRSALFNKWRRAMCGFLGIPPGPSLGDGGMRVLRG